MKEKIEQLYWRAHYEQIKIRKSKMSRQDRDALIAFRAYFDALKCIIDNLPKSA